MPKKTNGLLFSLLFWFVSALELVIENERRPTLLCSVVDDRTAVDDDNVSNSRPNASNATDNDHCSDKGDNTDDDNGNDDDDAQRTNDDVSDALRCVAAASNVWRLLGSE
jgi:hypothetical protein